MDDSSKMVVMVRHCARCENDHEIAFRPFKGNAFIDADGAAFDWWGFCPITGDPVLLNSKIAGLVIPASEALPPQKEVKTTTPKGDSLPKEEV